MANGADYRVMQGKKVIRVGTVIERFDGQKVMLSGFQAPQHNGSTGRVDLRSENGKEYLGQFFPSVIGAVIVRVWP